MGKQGWETKKNHWQVITFLSCFLPFDPWCNPLPPTPSSTFIKLGVRNELCTEFYEQILWKKHSTVLKSLEITNLGICALSAKIWKRMGPRFSWIYYEKNLKLQRLSQKWIGFQKLVRMFDNLFREMVTWVYRHVKIN